MDINKERLITDFRGRFITGYTGFYFVTPAKQGTDRDLKVGTRLFESQRMLVFVCQDFFSEKYHNNGIECDHGKLKRSINPVLGFKTLKTAYATLKGIEVMRALRKGQAEIFYYGHPLGEGRLVNSVFGL